MTPEAAITRLADKALEAVQGEVPGDGRRLRRRVRSPRRGRRGDRPRPASRGGRPAQIPRAAFQPETLKPKNPETQLLDPGEQLFGGKVHPPSAAAAPADFNPKTPKTPHEDQ